MKFHNDNLDYTVGKYNNPYGIIQKAGLKLRIINGKSKSKSKSKRKTRRHKHKKTRKNHRS